VAASSAAAVVAPARVPLAAAVVAELAAVVAADAQRAAVAAAPAAVVAAAEVAAAAPAAVAAAVVAAAVVALAVLAAEAAVAAEASAAESAARYSAAAAELVVRPAARRPPHHLVDADRDVPRAAPAARPVVHSLLAESWTELSWARSSAQWSSVPSCLAAAPSANPRPVAALARRTLAAAEMVSGAALARAQPTASVPRLVRRAADAFLIGPARFSRVVAEQSPQRLAE
jgi:hypothetical protein